MLVELPSLWIAFLNVFGIPTAHLFIAWGSNQLPSYFFRPQSFLYRTRAWEKKGKIYQRIFRVKRWKDSLPDGAAWLSGFAKGSLLSNHSEYLKQFQIETCRGEFSHWIQMMAISLFIIWTPFPASIIIIAYALLSNLPCIISQRYSRGRMIRSVAE